MSNMEFGFLLTYLYRRGWIDTDWTEMTHPDGGTLTFGPDYVDEEEGYVGRHRRSAAL